MDDDRTTSLAVLLDDAPATADAATDAPTGGATDAPGGPVDAPRRRPHPLRNAVLGLVVCGLVLAAIPVTAWLWVNHRIEGRIHRLPGVFAGLTNRPAKPTTGTAARAENILLLGTDRRSDVPTTGKDAGASAWVPGAQRSDTMMLLHIDGDRLGASVISIPRDSWVSIPGHGMGKINWAYSFGGPTLAVATFEQLTGVRVDHLAVVDWDGFIALTDEVGGVDVEVPDTVHDSARDITWTAGLHHLDGQQALNYVGERYGLPGGDLDRVRRQQAFLRTVMSKALEQELWREPTKLYRLLHVFTDHASVDDTWSWEKMAGLGVSLRRMRSFNIRYLTVPVTGTGRVGDQSVVRLAPAADRDLWDSVRFDRMDQWSAVNWRLLTPDVVH